MPRSKPARRQARSQVVSLDGSLYEWQAALGDRLSLQVEKLRELATLIANSVGDASVLADILVDMLDDRVKPLIAEVHELERVSPRDAAHTQLHKATQAMNETLQALKDGGR